MRGDGLAVFSEFGVEIPVELGPGGVAVDVDGDIARSQLAFGKSFSHQTRVDVLLDLVKAVFVAKRVDEGNFGRVPPDLGCKCGVRAVDGLRIFGDEAANGVDIRVRAGRLGSATGSVRGNSRSFWRAGLFFRRSSAGDHGSERDGQERKQWNPTRDYSRPGIGMPRRF